MLQGPNAALILASGSSIGTPQTVPLAAGDDFLIDAPSRDPSNPGKSRKEIYCVQF